MGDTRTDEKVASKMPELAKLRDSADTAGGRILPKLALLQGVKGEEYRTNTSIIIIIF